MKWGTSGQSTSLLGKDSHQQNQKDQDGGGVICQDPSYASYMGSDRRLLCIKRKVTSMTTKALTILTFIPQTKNESWRLVEKLPWQLRESNLT